MTAPKSQGSEGSLSLSDQAASARWPGLQTAEISLGAVPVRGLSQRKLWKHQGGL